LAYIGNIPAESYASFETETFSVSATANYTLSHAVTNENEIRLVINGVVQQPGSGKAYTASGTTLTLTSATVSGDVMYAVYLGRALQTVNPPNASVGNSQTAPTIITGQTAETSIATDDTILIHDTSASALRKMTRANFVSGIGGTNTPNFFVISNATTNASDNTWTKVALASEVFDSANAFASSKFTVPSGQGGKYHFSFKAMSAGASAYQKTGYSNLYLNGSSLSANYETIIFQESGVFNMDRIGVHGSVILNLSAGDYIELYAKADVESGSVYIYNSFLGGYKIIE
jgi:hypothetical protein